MALDKEDREFIQQHIIKSVDRATNPMFEVLNSLEDHVKSSDWQISGQLCELLSKIEAGRLQLATDLNKTLQIANSTLGILKRAFD